MARAKIAVFLAVTAAAIVQAFVNGDGGDSFKVLSVAVISYFFADRKSEK